MTDYGFNIALNIALAAYKAAANNLPRTFPVDADHDGFCRFSVAAMAAAVREVLWFLEDSHPSTLRDKPYVP